MPEVGELVSRFGTRYLVVSCEPAADQRRVVTLAEEEVPVGEMAAGLLT